METAGNGASITSTMSLPISPGLSIARLSSPRSPTEPTTVVDVVLDATGSWETRCSCSRLIASLTFWCVCTVTNGGISPAAVFSRSTSPTVRSLERSRNPYWRIQASLKIFDRYARPPSGRITAIIACGSSTSLATCSAACTARPHEPPTSRPSSAASRRVVRKLSLSETVT